MDLSEELVRKYGVHRSGWSYAVNSLSTLNSAGGVKLISFIEKKFIFGGEKGEILNKFQPVDYPWVGFIHVPVGVPSWFNGHYAPDKLFNLKEFKEALGYCKGLFTLSSPLAVWISKRFEGPVSNVLHPTSNDGLQFNPSILNSIKKLRVVQLGFWLRKLHSIYSLDLPAEHFRKTIVGVHQSHQKKMMEVERRIFGFDFSEQIEFTGYLDPSCYDQILSESVVFVDFYDTSANNAIIESIVRCTPILTPPMQAIAEYLGSDYPLYYENYDQARELLCNRKVLLDAHLYLKQEDVQGRVRAERFLEDVYNSEVYQNINHS